MGEPHLLPRLRRRMDGLRWRGVTHEDIDAWSARRPDRVSPIAAALVHYGAVPAHREARATARAI